MKTRCDKCGEQTTVWAELRLPPVFKEVLAFPEFKKKKRGGGTIFRFCLCCTFESPTTDANAARLIVMTKETLGISQTRVDYGLN